jgi:hypothetical protein
MCPLCYCIPETTAHMLTQFNFAEALWNPALANLGGPNQWMKFLHSKGTGAEKE